MLQRQGNCLAAGVLLSVEQWGKEGCGGVPKPASPPPLKQDANEQVERWQAGGGGGGAISYERRVAGSDRVKQETRR